MLNNLEKGDIIAIKNAQGETRSVTVLQVKPDYDRPGSFVRFDYIDHNEASPMRRTAWPKDVVQILKKTTNKPFDPKSPRAGDVLAGTPQKAIIIDGKTYVEKTNTHQSTVPVNEGVGPQVHEAVKAPAKPVIERIKKSVSK